MIVVALNGPKQAGKNTASAFIERWAAEGGVRVVQRGFADLLKLSAYRIFKPDCTLAEAIEWADDLKFNGEVAYYIQHNGEQTAAASITGRSYLQQYGTESHRDVFGDNFWVDQLLPRDELARIRAVTKFDAYNDDYRYPEICTVTDLRFQNEAARVQDVGGFVCRIDRPQLDAADTHLSEQPLPRQYVDWVIENDGDFANYEAAVRDMADKNILPLLEKK